MSGDLTFAILSDRTGGERPGVFEHAVRCVNLLRPDLVIGIGDLVEGYEADVAELHRQWDEVDGLLGLLEAPFHAIPGNHDVSNDAARAVWRERRGPEWTHFVERDVLFLLLSTEDPPGLPQHVVEQLPAIRSAMAAGEDVGHLVDGLIDWEGDQDARISDAQVAYFEDALRDVPDPRWTFVFLHRPAWQGGGDARFARIEQALGGRPYTTFAGHVHSYKRTVVDDRVRIRLGATGGVYVLPDAPGNFDHVTLVSMAPDGPRIANILLDGILDETGERRILDA